MRIFILVLPFVLFVNCTVIAQRTGERFRHLLGFVLDEDSLGTVQQRLGPAALFEEGDAGGYEARISYIIPSRSTLITFLSDELGGSSHYIGGFALRKIHSTGDGANQYLTISLDSSNSLNIDIGGLMLGMSKREFSNSLGQTVSWAGDTALFSLSGQDSVLTSDNKPQVLDIYLSIRGIFARSKLEELEVWLSRTY